jgi:hypothetical protein
VKKVSVVYFLSPFVYSSSIGWFGSRPGLAVARSVLVSAFGLPLPLPFDFGFACCAATGTTSDTTTRNGSTRLKKCMVRNCNRK